MDFADVYKFETDVSCFLPQVVKIVFLSPLLFIHVILNVRKNMCLPVNDNIQDTYLDKSPS